MNQNTENMSLEEALVYIKALKDENERLKQQNANLTEQIIRNQKKMYGKSSEQIRYIYDSEQLSFFNEAEQEYSASAPEPTKETLVAAHTRKAKRTKAEITENLEHKKIICDLEDKHCPECGEELVCIGKEFVRSGLNISPAPDDDIEEYKNQIKDKKTDLLVVFPNKFTISDSTTSQLSNIDIFYNSDKSSSMEMYSRVIFQFTNMQPRLFTFNEISDEKYDLFDVNAMTRKFLGGIIPFVVFLSVYLVCMNLAANSIAGDKEKGFLNTLLVTPVKRRSIAAGKSISILIVAMIASCSSCIGMAFSMPKLSKAIGLTNEINYSISEYLILFFSVVTGALVLVSLLLIFSTLAKDVKQATTFSPLLMIVIMVPAMLSSTENFSKCIEKLGMANYFIPVWSSVKMLQDVISMECTLQHIIITFTVNIIAAIICVLVIGRLFNTEKIIND